MYGGSHDSRPEEAAVEERFRGLMTIDTLTGRCKCNKDFASSNGMGVVGIRDDCGYLD